MAVFRFLRIRRALQTGGALPIDVFPGAFAAVVTLLGATLTIYVIAMLV